MLLESPRCRIFKKIYFFLTVLLLISAAIGRAFSALNSIVIILLLTAWIFEGAFREKISRLKKEPMFFILLALYLLYILSIFHSVHRPQALFIAQRELPLILIPTILLTKESFSRKEIAKIFTCFVFAVFVWMSIATLSAIQSFIQNRDFHTFFYHSLVKRIQSTAIYASMLCILSLILIDSMNVSPKARKSLYFIFTLWLILLSSRMFLLIYAILFLIYIFSHAHKKYGLPAAVIGLGVFILLCFASGPLRDRFADIKKFKPDYLTERQFNNNIYFDGLSLRLVYVRYSLEIMREQHNYLLGVGTGDADGLLKEKIRKYHMNTGDVGQQDGGYLKYSFHNVYLETFVSLGFTGLICIFLFFGYIGWLGTKFKKPLLINIFVIVVLSACSDVIVLNSQADVSVIMVVITLSIMTIRSSENRGNIQDTITAN